MSKITGASSGDAEGNAKEEGAKFYKRWGIFHREDWEKAGMIMRDLLPHYTYSNSNSPAYFNQSEIKIL